MNFKSLNIGFHRSFIVSAFDDNDEANIQNISKLIEEYTGALEEMAPKVNYLDDHYGTDGMGEESPQYEAWSNRRSFTVQFAVPYEQSWAEPAIYATFEEMIEKEHGSVELDNDDYNNLKPREVYDEGEGLKVSRDKYGRWWVEHYDSDIKTVNYKISVNITPPFSIRYYDLEQFGYPDDWQDGICNIDEIHKIIMDCISKVSEGAMEPYYDYNQKEFMDMAEKEAEGMEELWDENDERQPEFNFESLKKMFGNRL
jgi:hypothetical protein